MKQRRFLGWLPIAVAVASCAVESGDGNTSPKDGPDSGVSGEPSEDRPGPSSSPGPSRPGTDRGEASELPPQVLGVFWSEAGTPGSLSEVYRAPSNLFCLQNAASCPGLAVDLEFNPVRRGELWVTFRQPYNGEPCTTSNQSGCPLLRSAIAVISNADTSPRVEIKEDGNSWHFMRLITALAFGDDDTFATVGEARTGNYLTNDPNDLDYMGPSLWSSDPAIFAQDFMLNGSHLDMIHTTPYGMGIAHEKDNVYWCFNGQSGAVDRVDFQEPHEPGGADHSDGSLRRYVEGQLQRRDTVPSHMAFASDKRWLYIADTGHGRVVALDTQSGQVGDRVVTGESLAYDQSPPDHVPSDEQRAVDGATLVEIVPPGVLPVPSGLTVYEDILFVADAQTSKIHLFDLDGNELEVFDTLLPEGTLSGITVGPDGRLYLADWPGGRVLRIDP